MNNEDEMYELDELQKHLQLNSTILKAKETLNTYNINEKDVKIFLSTELFVKFPLFFENINQELQICATKVYNQENLVENIEVFKILLNDWKQTNLRNIKNEIESMKEQTELSMNETIDENCKNCFNNQKNILNIANDYFEKKLL